MKTASILAAAAIAIALPFASGCTVYTTEAATVEADDAYTPTYYDGNVVYYDTVGTPYVYREDRVYYVPRTYAHYDVLVGHYHSHPRAYHSWYRSHPYRGHGRGRVVHSHRR